MSIKSLFENIADAIKDKNPNVTNVTPDEMPNAIRSIPSGSSSASGVTYDNTTSGLSATNVQDAIDEVVGDVTTINSDLSEIGTVYEEEVPAATDSSIQATIQNVPAGVYVATAVTGNATALTTPALFFGVDNTTYSSIGLYGSKFTFTDIIVLTQKSNVKFGYAGGGALTTSNKGTFRLVRIK